MEQIVIDPEGAAGLSAAILVRAGCSRAEAERVAGRLVGANLRGHDSHGLIRTPRYVEWLEMGRVYPDRSIQVLKANDVVAIVDGQYGLGQTVGEQTVDLGVRMAKAEGAAVTALRNAGHLGRIGDWAERAAEAGCASIHLVNVRGGLLVAPFGGAERRGGTSPFCAGVPVAGRTPIVLDFATSLVAEGKALVAARGGKPLPEGALIDPSGAPSADPAVLYGPLEAGRSPDPSKGPGALVGFGQHKGSGLNFFMEMFAGALTGSGTAGGPGETERRRFANAMLSIYLDVEFFHSDDYFATEVRGFVEFWKSARPATPGGEVLIPGEVEERTLAERQRQGLPLARIAWDDLLGTARRLGIAEAELESLIEACHRRD